MDNIKTYESYGEREIIFQHKHRSNFIITIVVQYSRIKSIDNPTGQRFPYVVGQPFNRGLETWACNNNYLMDGQDTCPDKKIFGIRTKDVPQGHEWRHIYPNKF